MPEDISFISFSLVLLLNLLVKASCISGNACMKQKGLKNPTKACPKINKGTIYGKFNRAEGPTTKKDSPLKIQPSIIINLFSICLGTN